MNINGGIDIGNGYVKGIFADNGDEVEKFDIPAAAATRTSPDGLAESNESFESYVADDFFNNIEISCDSPSVKSTHRQLIGKRALNATAQRFEEFNLESRMSKAEQDLSRLLLLSVFAAKAVKNFITKNKKLPEKEIVVTASVALSLPIDEYREHRKAFSASLKDAQHIVHVHNFETPITVRVKFVNVEIFAEGAAAQYALNTLGVNFAETLLKKAQKTHIELHEVTAQMIFNSTNTLGIDIGEGTVNFPVHLDGKFNTDTGRSFGKGYGTVLLNSLTPLERKKIFFTSRRSLSEFLLTPPSPLKKQQYNEVLDIVEEHCELFAEEIAEEFRKVFVKIRNSLEVIYVFGGGANAVKKFLHPLLLEITQKEFPILFLDTDYSRYLNREGLIQAVSTPE